MATISIDLSIHLNKSRPAQRSYTVVYTTPGFRRSRLHFICQLCYNSHTSCSTLLRCLLSYLPLPLLRHEAVRTSSRVAQALVQSAGMTTALHVPRTASRDSDLRANAHKMNPAPHPRHWLHRRALVHACVTHLGNTICTYCTTVLRLCCTYCTAGLEHLPHWYDHTVKRYCSAAGAAPASHRISGHPRGYGDDSVFLNGDY